MDALRGLAWLLLAQSAGEALVRLAGAPLPGPVLGLLLMLAALRWAPVQRHVGAAADALLAHLSLLFVPVGVGVMTHFALISQYGARMLLVIVVATWAGMAVTALVLRALLPRGA
ncbi:MAG: CidA/LrgA family protein [Piscinibacter sp.]|uniref:CidA/LrgA family protein n=1 Tax=Piscinibacter sp. TaxID=1903157 RepID=UPI003D0E58A0